MKATYRNVAIAAGGALAVAVAARLLRSFANSKHPMLAQTMTVLLDRETVIERLGETMIRRAVECDDVHVIHDAHDTRLFEWTCAEHPSENARLALIAAPGDRGTELHIAMHGDKYDVKDVVRRLKMLLETGEIATGARA